MSKITDELHKAELERQHKGPMSFSGYFSAIKQELQAELGWTSRAPAPSSINGSGAAPGSSPTGSPVALDEAVARAARQVEAVQQQLASQQAEQIRLTVRLAESAQLIKNAEQERQRLAQRLGEVTETTASLETARASQLRRLEALRECQALAADAKKTEEELRANALVISQHEDRARVLQQHLEQIRFKLAQALAVYGNGL